MSQEILVVRNIIHEGLGTFMDVIDDAKLTVELVDAEKGQPIPPPMEYGAMIVLGGPVSANDTTKRMDDLKHRVRQAVEHDVPYLGVCLGHQVLAVAQTEGRGWVSMSPEVEIGFADANNDPYEVKLTAAGKKDPLLKGVPPQFRVFQLHGEEVADEPKGGKILGYSVPTSLNEDPVIQILKVGKVAYGLQGHVELNSEMLDMWAREDPELKNMGRKTLLDTLASYPYEDIGKTIIRNFLAIAKLL